MEQANVVELEDSIWKQKAEWSFTEIILFSGLCFAFGFLSCVLFWLIN